MRRLVGKNALITGGTSGIGFATAKLFLEEGARVIITGFDQGRVDEAVRALGGEVVGLRADAASVEDSGRLASEVAARMKALDVLFLNAGIAGPAPLEAITPELFDHVVGVNYRGPFFTLQKLSPLLVDKGAIVLTTSVGNNKGEPFFSLYSSSKAALRSLARCFAAILAPRGIRVNAVSPGPIDTPLYQKLGLPPEMLSQTMAAMIERVPLKRFAAPAEVASAVLFLATPASSYVNGVELVVDGGMTQL